MLRVPRPTNFDLMLYVIAKSSNGCPAINWSFSSIVFIFSMKINFPDNLQCWSVCLLFPRSIYMYPHPPGLGTDLQTFSGINT